MRLSKLNILLATAALAAAVGGCGGSSGSSTGSNSGSPATKAAAEGTPKPGGTVTFALNAGWDTLDPATTAFTFSRQIMQFIFDPLLRHDPRSGKIVPGLAKSFTISSDGKRITLQLPSGVKFQDGTPCDAKAVVFSLKRIEDPALHSPWAETLLGPVKAVTAKGPLTVVIDLKAINASFLDALTEVNLAPVSPAAVKKYGKDFGAHPVGTGPFTFQSEVPNQNVKLTRNPDYNWAPALYHRQGPAYLQDVVVRNVPEDATRMALLQSGDIDIVYQPIPAQVPSYRSNHDYKVAYASRSGMPRSLVLNTQMFPFDDKNVRMAVAHAINKAQIVKSAWGLGPANAANSILTPHLLGYSAQAAGAAPKYDVAQAKKLLSDDGWKPGSNGILQKNGKSLSFNYEIISGTGYNIEAQVIQSNLKAIGMQAKIVTVEQAAVLDDMRSGKNALTTMLFAATDPDVLYTILASGSIDKAWNTARYSNPEMDKILTQARSTNDNAQREQLYGQAQELVNRDVPYVPFYNISDPWISRARVNGLTFDAQGFWDGYTTWVSQ
jgi:peptide/nickel transport system substrate-binding protein